MDLIWPHLMLVAPWINSLKNAMNLAAATTESDRDEEIHVDILFTFAKYMQNKDVRLKIYYKQPTKNLKNVLKLLESIINSKNENIQTLPIETLELY